MQTAIREEFAYLNRLRESGECNMYGAGQYLVWEFGLERREARKVLSEWMAWVEQDNANRDR